MTSPECELYLAKSENAKLSSVNWATMGGGEDYLKRKLVDISYCFLHARHSSGNWKTTVSKEDRKNACPPQHYILVGKKDNKQLD